MNIQVYPHRIILNKTNEVNSGEYNVNECTFEFSQEYEGLTKVAVFSLCDGTTKNVTILNNQCIIPVECLQETGQVQIGVYGYATQDNELVLRYSPTPQNFVVRLGSYKEGTQPVAPTPTDWEILVEQVSDIAEDVSSIHEDITGINGEISGINIDIRDLQDTKANISDLAEVAFTGEFSDLKNIPSYATTQQLNQEIQDRQDADTNLQSQIDAISVSSDVVDVVGTYQELVDYDTQHLKDNDIVKVLQDSTHSDALSYYRWDKETSTWSYVGSEGPFYTKSETDALLNDKQDLIDINNMLSSDLVDDTNSTNKFVTQADITNWNNKEDKSNKVTEINSSSTDTQYPSAKCIYDSQEEQNEHIAELEMLYNAFPTVSDENETIQLDNTAKVKFREIDLKGNTSQVVIPEEQGTSVSNTSIYVSDVNTDKENTIEISGNTYQETTTGKNLLNIFNLVTGTKSGITCTFDSTTQEITFNGTCDTDNTFFSITNQTIPFTSGTTKICAYYVSGSITNYGNFRTFGASYSNNDYIDLTQLSSSNNTITKTTSTTIDKTIFDFRFNNGSVATNLKIKVMITDNSDTTWEKFTFGASPNPDFPQNIEVVTGENNITICGKNIFNEETEIGGWNFTEGEQLTKATTSHQLRCTNKIIVAPNTNYILSVNGNAVTETVRFIFADKNNIILSSTTNSNGTILTPNNCEYLVFHSSAFKTTYGSTLPNPMIENGTTITTYEPYVSQTYPINLSNIELCKISTYQDKIYKQNNKWYLEKNIDKVVLNGTQPTGFVRNTGTSNWYYVFVNLTQNTPSDNGEYIISSHYKGNSIYNSNTNNGICATTTSKELRIRYGTEDTIANFKNWLSNNNVTVYYVLTTPTTTEITDTALANQLNALYNATIYPITNINTDTSNLLPYIDLHYNFVTPSPSPSRPSVVNVVKGNNAITISNSDNTESQVFPINLGDMELCKIGTYQDYIYESNGNWFKKGNISKVVLNGSESWQYISVTQGSFFRNNDTITNDINDNTYIPYSNNYKGIAYNNYLNRANNQFYIQNQNDFLDIIDNRYTSASDFKTWLSTHNTMVYYPLATPTDTRITDTTLITQLNNIKKAYSYDTQTNISQTNADKPFIIYAEAIRSLKDVFE